MREDVMAFALIGDRFHNSDYIRTALGKTLGRELGLTIEFTDDVSRLNAETLCEKKLLIIFRDALIWPDGYGAGTFWQGEQARDPKINPFEQEDAWYPGYKTLSPLPRISDPPVPDVAPRRVNWMTTEQGRIVREFVEGGGAAFFYHNATYIASENANFRDVLGAATQDHPPIRPFKVRITNPDHPITRGIGDFIVTDEQHFLTYDRDAKFVFMQSINEDGLTHKNLGTSCEAGWAYDYGKGRVCYLAPGHSVLALWNPEYVKLQQNAARWLLREI